VTSAATLVLSRKLFSLSLFTLPLSAPFCSTILTILHSYWDWTYDYMNPQNHPIFDGSDVSLGSDGIYIPNREPRMSVASTGRTMIFPPGTGGGCVERGPFVEGEWQFNLGPVAFVNPPQGPDGGLGYNPRCMDRDLSNHFTRNLNPVNVTNLLHCQDYQCFAQTMDAGAHGLHSSGHYGVGGMQADSFVSPSDPVFYAHHGQLDRLWTIWQFMGNYTDRINQLWGTLTSGNNPPSANATLDTVLNFGVIADGETVRIRDVVSSIDNGLCFMYE